MLCMQGVILHRKRHTAGQYHSTFQMETLWGPMMTNPHFLWRHSTHDGGGGALWRPLEVTWRAGHSLMSYHNNDLRYCLNNNPPIFYWFSKRRLNNNISRNGSLSRPPDGAVPSDRPSVRPSESALGRYCIRSLSNHFWQHFEGRGRNERKKRKIPGRDF